MFCDYVARQNTFGSCQRSFKV